MNPPKILIIKLGRSETFHPRVDDTPSLGDVFVTTMVLHPFKDHHVTWLTDGACVPLLEGNSHIDRLLPYNLTSILQLQSEAFDMVVNLEKVPGVCALADSIKSPVKHGYCFDWRSGKVYSRDKVLEPYLDLEMKKSSVGRFWPEVLFEVVNRKWDGEKCILGHSPERAIGFDVGLNYKVGAKWPNKAWPEVNFIVLERMLKDLGYGVSWQKGDNIREYVDWIGKCRMLVTNDSLGLHLAIAMDRKVVLIVGPTDLDGRYVEGSIVRPEGYACAPCWESECKEEVPCVESIEVERVLGEVRGWLV